MNSENARVYEDFVEHKDEGHRETYVVHTMMRENIDDKDGLPDQRRIIT